MTKRKLLTGLASAGVFSAGFGAAVLPASAELRMLTVTLLGGTTTQVAADVPPGTPLEQVTIPGITVPIIGISDAGPVPTDTTAPASTTDASTDTVTAEAPAPAAPAPAAADPAAPATPTDPATPGTPMDPLPGDVPVAGTQDQQKTTGSKQAKDTSGDKAAAAPSKAKPKPKAPADAPTPADPTYSFAIPGPAPIGVPNFFIEKFRIPPFLLSIYQAAGIQYGVRWEILAAINEIETDYGRNLNVSTAGALGWMQFLPSTFKRWGVDANSDGHKDPYNPVDAIFSAARYLKAAGADSDV
ncbi:MAG: hypothetical protein QOH43_359, partial [Solirubrobacteraceae bacterium]|nr:hypothetical protein [Solirubrobacteraceae bacterium]